MDRIALKHYHKRRRKLRVRKKISGTALMPRISVYKSNRHFYLQAIDDGQGVTIANAGTYGQSYATMAKDAGDSAETARLIGSRLAQNLLEQKITRAVYDCNGNRYHGIVRKIADSIRAAGVVM